ncbi:MAG: hypothetical protein JXR07_03615 [Reichenbachiella sp.]
MKVDYRTQYYFPKHIVTFGHVLIFMGAVVMTLVHWIAGAVLVTIGLLTVSLNFGLAIDTTKKVYHDYLFVLGVNTGKKRPYERIEYLYVTESKKTTIMQSRGSKSEISHHEFNGYIKFSEDEKVHLLSSRKKQKVMHFLEKMSAELDLDIKDFS